MTVAFFGQEAGDPAVQRRIAALTRCGWSVDAYTFRRESAKDRPFENVDLGLTHDGQFVHRLGAIIRTPHQLRHVDRLKAADIFWARNLDMLAIADRVRRRVRPSAPLVYEALDIHRLLTTSSPIGLALRGWERQLLRRTALLIVSSPDYVSEYFEKRQGRVPPWALIENRLPPAGLPPRPHPDILRPQEKKERRPLRLVWAGKLRCERSFALLRHIATTPPTPLHVDIWGRTSTDRLTDLDQIAAATPHMTFHGPYAGAEGLSRVYGNADLVWVNDYLESRPGGAAATNSAWQLPNRLYEGGYFGAVPVAVANTASGRFVKAHDIGFVIEEPTEASLPALLGALSHADIDAKRRRLLAAPRSVFVDDDTPLRAAMEKIAP
ncbi:glycosyltransferase, succinoglycan biosynthesis protein ExoL [Parvularcula bermudensis HTCC2503]|uniref:Glycosyltransferase, succinoglycan biosynthesis protein ExoL n=1 Tax=Parvularcula bermudensis (strain ATCC BAA-594 / HTCC2503 / KCTC 12087) TaxID=314260 RepID=E0TBN7_PARBH|nr:glycosyltransferase succinoglycan biosynthesis protein ExoL [Parvularcula bermudensis]ADM08412.1 glycosyltransferase, succinoglycan biosynthesis protein ExoL [Parvularcula bermudensis HTCC2503]